MAEQPTYIFSEFCLDAARRLLTRNGEQIDLSPKAFDLLLALIENRGRVLSKDELLDKVWDGQFVEENNLAVQVSALRKAFGETSHDHRFIVTVPGKGYKFVAEIGNGAGETVAVVNGNGRSFSEPDLNPTAAPASDSVAPAVDAGGFESRWILAIIGLILAAALLIGAFSAFLPDRSSKVASGSDSPPKIRQLTTKGRVGLTAISPNGEFFAYTIDTVGERKRGIWLAQMKGGQHIELRPPDDNIVLGIAFSPDGESLYFTLGDSETSEGGLFQMPILGGGEKKIASAPRTAFDLAPDGTRLAYYRKSKQVDGGALVVANLDGTDEREVITRTADKSFRTRAPAFSPDGSIIAVSAVVDPDMEREEILIVDAATGETRQLTNSNWKLVQGLVWSASGDLIAVAIGNNESLRHLWKISHVDGKAVRISSDTVDYAAPIDISRDGKSLIAEQLNIESNIWIGPSEDVAQARQVTFSSMNGAFGWSSLDWISNDMLVFDGGIERNRAVFTMRSSGADVRPITSGGYFDHHVAASPDGRTIFFCSDRSGRNEIWSVSFDGSDLKQITYGEGCASPDVAPDGSRILYVSNRHGKESIWSVPIGGGEPVRLIEERSLDPKFSPDGKLIACGFWPPDGSPVKVAILDSQTGAVVKMFKMAETTNFNGGINWTPDGKSVTIRDWANGIWKQELTGVQATRLSGLPGEKLYSYDWSPDGKTFAFARGRAIADAVLLTLD